MRKVSTHFLFRPSSGSTDPWLVLQQGGRVVGLEGLRLVIVPQFSSCTRSAMWEVGDLEIRRQLASSRELDFGVFSGFVFELS